MSAGTGAYTSAWEVGTEGWNDERMQTVRPEQVPLILRRAYARTMFAIPQEWEFVGQPRFVLNTICNRWAVRIVVDTVGAGGMLLSRTIVLHTRTMFKTWVDMDVMGTYTGVTTFGILDMADPGYVIDRLEQEFAEARKGRV